MSIRLNKYLAQTGHYSRRQADELMAAGRVKVNGKVIDELGYQLTQPHKAQVLVDDKPVVVLSSKPQYMIFYKPTGVLTTRRDERQRQTIYDCLPPNRHHLKPVGRLDRATSGLLLMTNDGDLHYRASHPNFHLPKVYQVRIEPEIQGAKKLANALLEGVWFEEEQVTARVEEVFQLAPDVIGLTLMTGYNRQIRRMLEKNGYQVKHLKRIAYGPLRVTGMRVGEFRSLTAQELTALKTALGIEIQTRYDREALKKGLLNQKRPGGSNTQKFSTRTAKKKR